MGSGQVPQYQTKNNGWGSGLHCWIPAVWSVWCGKTIFTDILGCSWDQQKVQWLTLTTCSIWQVLLVGPYHCHGMLNRTIPWQLQGEVRKCLDAWLRQGIIRPSKSLYVSQVDIVIKKTGEIWLCVNYQMLNSVVVRDAFSLLHIDEALQAVQTTNSLHLLTWHGVICRCLLRRQTSKKTAFRAGSSGLYEFTHMPFRLFQLWVQFL